MTLIKFLVALIGLIGFALIVVGFCMVLSLILFVPGIAFMAMGAMLAVPAGKILEALE